MQDFRQDDAVSRIDCSDEVDILCGVKVTLLQLLHVLAGLRINAKKHPVKCCDRKMSKQNSEGKIKYDMV